MYPTLKTAQNPSTIKSLVLHEDAVLRQKYSLKLVSLPGAENNSSGFCNYSSNKLV